MCVRVDAGQRVGRLHRLALARNQLAESQARAMRATSRRLINWPAARAQWNWKCRARELGDLWRLCERAPSTETVIASWEQN